jgi:predicted HicB family RNase H-like nuclease
LSPDKTGHPTQFPLRLAKSLREAATAMAMRQGISLNHFISLALAEKINRENPLTASPDPTQSFSKNP